jgi:DNA-directed RNA polymerase subunit RPC12/RpoP
MGLFDSLGKPILLRGQVFEVQCRSCGHEFFAARQLQRETVRCPNCRADCSVNGSPVRRQGSKAHSRSLQDEEPSIKCLKCGTRLDITNGMITGSVQCSHCKSEIELPKPKCPACKTHLGKYLNTCNHCGRNLTIWWENKIRLKPLVSTERPPFYCSKCNMVVNPEFVSIGESQVTGYIGASYNLPHSNLHPMMVRPVYSSPDKYPHCPNCGSRLIGPTKHQRQFTSIGQIGLVLSGFGVVFVVLGGLDDSFIGLGVACLVLGLPLLFTWCIGKWIHG